MCDTWGKLISKSGISSDYASIYEYNPLTYRGYIYDSETGFYYLQSRYYDPSVGRFLNADDTAYLGATGTLLSLNAFAYCENDAVNNADYSGCLMWPGEIHRHVQLVLAAYITIYLSCFTYTEYFIRFGFLRYGYADLYAKKWNEIWEVKPLAPRYRITGPIQLQKYIDHVNGSKKGRSLGIFKTYYFSSIGIYEVDIYSEANDGMIYYEYHYCWRVNAAILAAVGSIVLIASGAGAPAGVAGLGALVLA